MLLLLYLNIWLPMFRFLCYWWEVTPWNVHIAYLIFPNLFNIGNFVFWNHWVHTSAGGTLVPEGIHQPSCQTCLTWNLSNNVLQKFAAFDKILKHWKYGKALKSIHLVWVPAVGFGFRFRFVWIWVLLLLYLNIWLPMFRF